MVPAPSLGRGMGNSQCCRQGTGGVTTGEIFTSLLTRKTMCIPQMQSFSQCSPLASMTAPLAPPHGRRASWQVGELEFPSPAYFHPSFRAGRTVQPSGTETLQTQVRTTPGCWPRLPWPWDPAQCSEQPGPGTWRAGGTQTTSQELRQEHTPTSSQLSSTIPKEPKHPVFVLLMGRF